MKSIVGQRGTGKAIARRAAGSAGMTLLEIVVGFALLVAISLGFLYTAMGTVRMNRLTELEIAATNAVSGQLDAIMSAASDNSSAASGTAKGLILFLQKLESVVGNTSGYPIRVALDGTSGILYYEFPVARPGTLTTASATDTTSSLDQRMQDSLGRGVMMVYLKENHVPSEFYAWNDITSSGGTEVVTPGGATFYDMDGDGEPGGDFTSLFRDPVENYRSSTLMSLPITIGVRFYSSRKALEAGGNGSLPGFTAEDDASEVALTRSFILNNESVIGMGML